MSDPCIEFLQNPDYNPITKRRIKRFGPTYNELIENCGQPEDQPVRMSPSGNSRTPQQFSQRKPPQCPFPQSQRSPQQQQPQQQQPQQPSRQTPIILQNISRNRGTKPQPQRVSMGSPLPAPLPYSKPPILSPIPPPPHYQYIPPPSSLPLPPLPPVGNIGKYPNFPSDLPPPPRQRDDYISDCVNDTDPLTGESLIGLNPDDIIKITSKSGNTKTCYLVDSIYEYILKRMRMNMKIVNPSTLNGVNEELTPDEINMIFLKKGIYVYPKGFKLNIFRDGKYDHYFISLPNGDITDLGYIPNLITSEETGSEDYTSDRLAVLISQLWDQNKIIKSFTPITCCTIEIGKSKEYWEYDTIEKFLDLYEKVQDLI